MIKIIHLITDLDTGGAEMMLFKLVSNMNPKEYDNQVISLTNNGAIGEKLQSMGVPVFTLGMRRGIISISGMRRLFQIIKKRKPDIIQTWMYHSDLIGGIIALLAGSVPVVWNIRQSNLEPSLNKKTTIMTAKMCALLSSRVPHVIICGSKRARDVHSDMGYQSDKIVVIPNGFDLTYFHPDPEARSLLSEELSLPDNSFVIGLVARYDPQKDHRTFILAANSIAAMYSNVHFVLCGENINWANEKLVESIGQYKQRFHLLGTRQDIPKITASFDLACSSSVGEGFANVIGEAMASGVPCVVTDVGDSAFIVGSTGIVVPPGNIAALAEAISMFINMSSEARIYMGTQARRRIEENFSLSKIVARYEALYKETTKKCAG
jgi:glycosyltransferase involved in cell wall biosynthesis